jgi:hypothetical protein
MDRCIAGLLDEILHLCHHLMLAKTIATGKHYAYRRSGIDLPVVDCFRETDKNL